MPLVGSVFIFFAAHFLDILFGGDLHHFSGQFGVVLDIVCQMGDDAPESIVSFKEVVFYGDGDLLEDHALGV